jgi:SAM-dependent methyltransferase
VARANGEQLERERVYWNGELEARERSQKYYSVMAEMDRVSELRMLPFAVPGSNVLEIGCSEGKFALHFFAERGARIAGIDIAGRPVEKARAEAERRGLTALAAFEIGDAHQLRWESGSFDLVYATGVLHHLDVRTAMDEVHRVVKPGGTAMFFEPLAGNPLINAYRALTPSRRTPDERPLGRDDLDAITAGWARSEVRFFHLTSLLAVPLRGKPLFAKTVTGLHALDRQLFRMPALRRLAWYAMITLSRSATRDEASAPALPSAASAASLSR